MSDAMSASDADRKCYSRGNTAKSKTRKAQYEHEKQMSKKLRKRNNSYDLYNTVNILTVLEWIPVKEI